MAKFFALVATMVIILGSMALMGFLFYLLIKAIEQENLKKRNELQEKVSRNTGNKINNEFVRRNNFKKGVVKWKPEQLNEIASFFEKSDKKIFKEYVLFTNILVLYETKNLLLFTPKTFWKYLKYDEIETIRVEKDGNVTSLGGAIVGGAIGGTAGAIIGSRDKNLKIHIITKGFNTENYTLTFSVLDNMNEIQNVLYQLYNVQ